MLVGYGHVGRRIGTSLREQKILFVVADQNRKSWRSLRKAGIPAVSGDASNPDVLIQAHIARAGMLVITIADALNMRKMVRTRRRLTLP